MNLNKIFSDITKKLDALDRDREDILKLSRDMIRNCSVAIKEIHRKNFSQYLEKIKEIKSYHIELVGLVKKNPEVLGKYLKTAEQEFMEAVCLYALINNEDIPSPEEYGVDPLNYLLGLADVIGELRRFLLDKIRKDDVEDLDKYLDRMEDIYTNLFSLDYPKGLLEDLRQKTDADRGIIERTRGDVSISVQINKLNENLRKKRDDDNAI